MSLFSINPLATQSLDLTQAGSRQVYQAQIAQCLQQLQGVVSQLASSYAPTGPGIVDFGTITSNQTRSVGGNLFTFLRFSSAITQTITVTLSALPQGGFIMIDANVTAGTLTLKLAGTDGGGNTYAISGQNEATGAIVDMVATGVAITARTFFFGMSGFVGTNASPQLDLLFT